MVVEAFEPLWPLKNLLVASRVRMVCFLIGFGHVGEIVMASGEVWRSEVLPT